MPLSPAPASSSPTDCLRRALMHSLFHAHRPELADVVASAELELDFPGVWLRPADSSPGAAWLEGRLWAAAVEESVPVEWIRVQTGRRGTEA